MVLRFQRTVLRRHMSVAAAICRIPNARFEIPARIGVTTRAVEGWMQGTTEPNATNLLALMREFDQFTDDVMVKIGRNDNGLTFEQKRKLLEVLGEK